MRSLAACPTFLALALAVLALVASPAAVQAQSAIRTDVDTTLVTVGDRITLTVSVEHAPDATVSWPDSLDLSPFEVVAAQALGTEPSGGRLRSSAAFLLTAFELGDLEIPSFDVAVLSAAGDREVLPTDRFGIEVVSVGADEGGDIREIRGPFLIPIGTITLLLWILALLALLAAGVFGYRRWRAGQGEVEIEPDVPARPAHEIALEALADIESSRMLSRGQVKEYHIAVSETIRRYIEARYRVRALEMTTGEIVSGLERVGVGPDFTGGLRRLLDQCDMVKFAKVRPDASRSAAILTLARELIEASIAWMPESEEDGSSAGDADAPERADEVVATMAAEGSTAGARDVEAGASVEPTTRSGETA